MAHQRAYLDDVWARADIVLDGDAALQQAVRFAIFHTLQAAARAEQRAIPAKGLTGGGYDGHSFWDMDTFVAAVLTYIAPEAAADALRWRHATLPLAEDRARELGYEGATFPWRTIRGQECSGYWPAGTAALHVNADVADAVRRYLAATGDSRLRGGPGDRAARRDGAAVALGRPPRRRGPLPHRRRHRTGRVQRPGRQQRLHEPHGGPEPALRRGGRGPPARSAPPTWAWTRRRWRPGATRPTASSCPTTSTSASTRRPRASPATACGTSTGTPPEKYPLLLHFPYYSLYTSQVVKQADLVLALYLCGDRFTPEEKARDFAYYEAITVRDSSLSACVQAIVAAEVGHLDLAYDYFGETAFVDLRDLNHNTKDGLHVASLAGTWLAAVCGFGGLRDHGEHLVVRPAAAGRASCGWQFRLLFRGRRLRVDVRRAVGALRARRRRAAHGAPPRRGGRRWSGAGRWSGASRPSTPGRRRASRRGASPGGGTSRPD